MPKRASGPTQLGRPRSDTAVSHAAIMDAVYELLKEIPARDLTMEAVARRAGVGKPTLYKWWPSKAALIMAMFQERLAGEFESPKTGTAEEAIRARMRRAIQQFNGLFGKVMADLIAEGQADPSVLNELYERHIGLRRASAIALVERGKAAGEFAANTDGELLIDAIVAPAFYRMLLRFAPLTEKYASALIDQVLAGVRPNRGVSAGRRNAAGRKGA